MVWGAVYRVNMLDQETQLCPECSNISSCQSPGAAHFVTGGSSRPKQQPGRAQEGVKVDTAHGAEERRAPVKSCPSCKLQ